MDLERESEIETKVGHFFLDLGYFIQKVPKLRTYGSRRLAGALTLNGIPDLYLLLNHRHGKSAGKFVGLEIKTPTGQLSDSQKEYSRLIRENGGLYFVIRSLSDAEAVHLALSEIC